MEKSTVLTPELTNLISQEIARYRQKHSGEGASDLFLRELSLDWLLVSEKLTIKSLFGLEIVGAKNVLGGLPENLCDDTLDFSALNLEGLLADILDFAVDALGRQDIFRGASDQLKLAMVMAFKLKHGEIERFFVSGVPWFRTTKQYEEDVALLATVIERG